LSSRTRLRFDWFEFVYFIYLEDKKDFVEQLNELSTKQHRRQYSGLNQLNAFHSRSSSVEPQQTNIQIKNDEENLSQTTKEEEILEKSRQMLEESKVKNEQLAEQVCFQKLSSLKN